MSNSLVTGVRSFKLLLRQESCASYSETTRVLFCYCREGPLNGIVSVDGQQRFRICIEASRRLHIGDFSIESRVLRSFLGGSLRGNLPRSGLSTGENAVFRHIGCLRFGDCGRWTVSGMNTPTCVFLQIIK